MPGAVAGIAAANTSVMNAVIIAGLGCIIGALLARVLLNFKDAARSENPA
jgi:hypothetical protein